jgi:hypothetical protein
MKLWIYWRVASLARFLLTRLVRRTTAHGELYLAHAGLDTRELGR